MAGVAELSVLIRAKDEISGTLDNIQRKSGGLASHFSNVLKVGALAAGAGIGAAAFAMVGFVREAAEAERIGAQTNAVLESTHGISGMTAQSVSDLANSLAAVIPIDDELIQKTENMLLTFTNIGRDVFPGATEAALNMSIALGEDSVASAMRLGKALNDPVAGVTALRRVGVQLTDQQKDQIESFMAVNDIAGAQKIILGELTTEFGNSGRAAGETFAGKMTILQTQIGNVKEAIGMALLPILIELATFVSGVLSRHMDDIETLFFNVSETVRVFFEVLRTGQGADSTGWFGRVEQAAEGLRQAFDTARPIVEEFFSMFMLGLETLQPVVEALFNFVRDNQPTMIALIAAIGVAIVLALGPAALAVGAIVGLIALIGLVRDNWDMIKAKTEEVFAAIGAVIDEKMGFIDEIIVGVVTGIVNFFRDNWQLMWNIVHDQLEAIRIVIVGAFTIFRDIFDFANAVIHGRWSEAWDALKQLVIDVFTLIKDVIINRLQFIRDIFDFGWAVIKGVFGGAWDWMKEKAGAVLGTIWDWVSSAWARVLYVTTSVWNQISGAMTGAMGSARDILRGIANTILTIVEGMINAIAGGINAIPDVNIPDWVPGIGGNSFGIPNIPTVHFQRFAAGGMVTSPWQLVGERGPELVALPRGSNVYSNAESRQMAGGAGGNTYITNIYVEDKSPGAIANAVRLVNLQQAEVALLGGMRS